MRQTAATTATATPTSEAEQYLNTLDAAVAAKQAELGRLDVQRTAPPSWLPAKQGAGDAERDAVRELRAQIAEYQDDAADVRTRLEYLRQLEAIAARTTTRAAVFEAEIAAFDKAITVAEQCARAMIASRQALDFDAQTAIAIEIRLGLTSSPFPLTFNSRLLSLAGPWEAVFGNGSKPANNVLSRFRAYAQEIGFRLARIH